MSRWVTSSEIASRYDGVARKPRMKSPQIRQHAPFFRILFPAIKQIRDDNNVIQTLNANSAYDRNHVEWMFENYTKLSRTSLPTIFPEAP